jgi:CRP/FNR family transcriptional regulator, anaerobic regulatory protein
VFSLQGAMDRDVDLPVFCRVCEARHGGICGALGADQLARLGRGIGRREVAPGTPLVPAHAAVEGYAIIRSGVVKLTKLLSDGRQQIVGLQFAPDFLGRPFSDCSAVGAEAASAVRLCTLPRSTLESMVREFPALQHRLYRQALRELDEARDWMMTLGQKSAGEKVASFLLLLSRHIDPLTGGHSLRFDIPLTRSNIADFLGLTIETVSRHISSLRKLKVIDVERNRYITIVDLPALLDAAGS